MVIWELAVWDRERLLTEIISYSSLAYHRTAMSYHQEGYNGHGCWSKFSSPLLNLPSLPHHLVPSYLHAHPSMSSQLLSWRWHLCSPNLKFIACLQPLLQEIQTVHRAYFTGILLRIYQASGTPLRVSHEWVARPNLLGVDFGTQHPIRLHLHSQLFCRQLFTYWYFLHIVNIKRHCP